jgi:hypothetical protein
LSNFGQILGDTSPTLAANRRTIQPDQRVFTTSLV